MAPGNTGPERGALTSARRDGATPTRQAQCNHSLRPGSPCCPLREPGLPWPRRHQTGRPGAGHWAWCLPPADCAGRQAPAGVRASAEGQLVSADGQAVGRGGRRQRGGGERWETRSGWGKAWGGRGKEGPREEVSREGAERGEGEPQKGDATGVGGEKAGVSPQPPLLSRGAGGLPLCRTGAPCGPCQRSLGAPLRGPQADGPWTGPGRWGQQRGYSLWWRGPERSPPSPLRGGGHRPRLGVQTLWAGQALSTPPPRPLRSRGGALGWHRKQGKR